jgi:hypothetical protein
VHLARFLFLVSIFLVHQLLDSGEGGGLGLATIGPEELEQLVAQVKEVVPQAPDELIKQELCE